MPRGQKRNRGEISHIQNCFLTVDRTLIYRNNYFAGKSQQIWEDLRNEINTYLSSPISSRGVYTICVKNYYNVWEILNINSNYVDIKDEGCENPSRNNSAKDEIDTVIKENKRIYGSNAKGERKRKSIDSICMEDNDDSTNKKSKCGDAKTDNKTQRNFEVKLERIDSKSFQKIREKQSRLLSTLTGQDDINLDEILITNLQEKELTEQHGMESLLDDDSNDEVVENQLVNEDEEQVEASRDDDNKSVLNDETSLPGESERKRSEPIKESADFYDKKSVPRKDEDKESVTTNSCSEVEDKTCSPNVDEYTKSSRKVGEDTIKTSINKVENKISSPSGEENRISVVESSPNKDSGLKDTSGGIAVEDNGSIADDCEEKKVINDSPSEESADKDKNITNTTSTDEEKKISDATCEDELSCNDRPTDSSEETTNELSKQVTITTQEVFNASELRETKKTTPDKMSDTQKEYIDKLFLTDPHMWKYFSSKDGRIQACNYIDFHKIFYPLLQNVHAKTMLLQATHKMKCVFQEETHDSTLLYKERIIRTLNLLHAFLKNIYIIDFEFEKVLRHIIEFEKCDYRYTMVGVMLLVAQMKTVHTSFGKLFFNSMVERCCVIARVDKSLYDQAYNILNTADPKMGESLELLLKSKIKLEIKEELAGEAFAISDDDDDDCCIVGAVKVEVNEEEKKTKSAQSPQPAKRKYVTLVPIENLMNPPPYMSGNAQTTPEDLIAASASTQSETNNTIPGYVAQSSWFPQNLVPTEISQPEMNNLRYPTFEQSSTECLSRLESMARQPYDNMNNFTTPTQQQEVPQSVEQYNYRMNMKYPGIRGCSTMTNKQIAKSPSRASLQFPPLSELPENHQPCQNQYPHIQPPYQPHPNDYFQRVPYNHQTWRASQHQNPHQFPAQSDPQQFPPPAVQRSLNEMRQPFAQTVGAADIRLFTQSAQQFQSGGKHMSAETVQYAQTVVKNTSRVPLHVSQRHLPVKQHPSRVSQQNNIQYAQIVGQKKSATQQNKGNLPPNVQNMITITPVNLRPRSSESNKPKKIKLKKNSRKTRIMGMVKIPNSSNKQEKKGMTQKRMLPVRYNLPESDKNQKFGRNGSIRSPPDGGICQ